MVKLEAMQFAHFPLPSRERVFAHYTSEGVCAHALCAHHQSSAEMFVDDLCLCECVHVFHHSRSCVCCMPTLQNGYFPKWNSVAKGIKDSKLTACVCVCVSLSVFCTSLTMLNANVEYL